MIDKSDWRLLHNDVEHLKMVYINPTDGEEIDRNAPYLKNCTFCLKPVQNSPHQQWFLPVDLSCCICETCFKDFEEMFQWKKLDGWDIDWGG